MALYEGSSFRWSQTLQYPLPQDARNLTNSTDILLNTTLVSTSCVVLEFEEYIPWNNPDNIISFQTEEIVFTLKVLFFLPVFFMIGCPANIINMVIFYKHGLKERINVCLFALALADEGHMVNSMLWFADQFYLRFTTREKQGPVVMFLIETHLVGLHGFIWVSQVLSAIIASERCFCVLYPLRSQRILRSSTMAAIVVSVYVVILGLVFFVMMRYKAVCYYDPLTGNTMTSTASSDLYFQHQQLIDYIDIFVLGSGLPGLVMIVVILTTVTTTAKLRQAALWRASTTTNLAALERDVAVTKMLVANSVFFIACVTPFAVFRILLLFFPKVIAWGRQHNFFLMIQYVLLIMSYFNSTFNIIIYYTMGSRYRQTFWQLFGKPRKSDK